MFVVFPLKNHLKVCFNSLSEDSKKAAQIYVFYLTFGGIGCVF